MESRGGGRPCDNPRAAPPYSQDTQDLLRVMMQESKLTNLQRKRITQCLQNGAALPLAPDPTLSRATPQPKTSTSVQKPLSGTRQRRSAESCSSGENYVREKYRPTPTRDLEKEKKRLQNIMATGQEEPTASSQHLPTRWNPDVREEKDLYQEVLDEIEERRQFLAEMASLGQEKSYVTMINTEIAQKIKELEELDKARSAVSEGRSLRSE